MSWNLEFVLNFYLIHKNLKIDVPLLKGSVWEAVAHIFVLLKDRAGGCVFIFFVIRVFELEQSFSSLFLNFFQICFICRI